MEWAECWQCKAVCIWSSNLGGLGVKLLALGEKMGYSHVNITSVKVAVTLFNNVVVLV